MPADASSSIPSALTQLTHADSLQPTEAPDLLGYLAAIHDPRSRRGRRHPLVAILAMTAAAVLTGARSLAAIAEWAADAPQPVRAALGARRDAPDFWSVPAEATIRRTLARLDPEALAAAIGAWLTDRSPKPNRRRGAVAVDGKTLRDARRDGRQVHLLAVMDHATRAVVAQRQVDGAPGEVPGFRPLLADRELADTVVTADALQTHRDAAEFFVVAKRRTTCWPSRPTSPPSCRAAPSLPGIVFLSWTARATRPTAGSSSAPSRPSRCITSGSRTPRRSSRSPQASWPTHPAVANRDGVRDHQPQLRQASPARLADLLRGQWAIENGLHWVRDVTFAEDGSQVRTGAAPQVMACLRNLVIGALSRAGPVNVAAALRRHARDPRRPLATLGIRLG